MCLQAQLSQQAATMEGLRGEVKAAVGGMRREWEVAIETASTRHAEQMAEGKVSRSAQLLKVFFWFKVPSNLVQLSSLQLCSVQGLESNWRDTLQLELKQSCGNGGQHVQQMLLKQSCTPRDAAVAQVAASRNTVDDSVENSG
jgi:hypothetical protein